MEGVNEEVETAGKKVLVANGIAKLEIDLKEM